MQPKYLEMNVDIMIKDSPRLMSEINSSLKGSTLIIFDDLIHSSQLHHISTFFSVEGRHQNISLMFLSQKLFQGNDDYRVISSNSNYMVLFNNPRNRVEVRALASQISPKSMDLLRFYEEATDDKAYSYMIVNLTQTGNSNVRYLGNLFANKHHVPVYNKNFNNKILKDDGTTDYTNFGKMFLVDKNSVDVTLLSNDKEKKTCDCAPESGYNSLSVDDKFSSGRSADPPPIYNYNIPSFPTSILPPTQQQQNYQQENLQLKGQDRNIIPPPPPVSLQPQPPQAPQAPPAPPPPPEPPQPPSQDSRSEETSSLPVSGATPPTTSTVSTNNNNSNVNQNQSDHHQQLLLQHQQELENKLEYLQQQLLQHQKQQLEMMQNQQLQNQQLQTQQIEDNHQKQNLQQLEYQNAQQQHLQQQINQNIELQHQIQELQQQHHHLKEQQKDLRRDADRLAITDMDTSTEVEDRRIVPFSGSWHPDRSPEVGDYSSSSSQVTPIPRAITSNIPLNSIDDLRRNQLPIQHMRPVQPIATSPLALQDNSTSTPSIEDFSSSSSNTDKSLVPVAPNPRRNTVTFTLDDNLKSLLANNNPLKENFYIYTPYTTSSSTDTRNLGAVSRKRKSLPLTYTSSGDTIVNLKKKTRQDKESSVNNEGNRSLVVYKPYVNRGGNKCDKCEEEFDSVRALRVHERTCLPTIKYPCKKCGKLLNTKSSLENHMKNMHERKSKVLGDKRKQLAIENSPKAVARRK